MARRAADLLIAFATLESYRLDDFRRPGSRGHPDALTDVAAARERLPQDARAAAAPWHQRGPQHPQRQGLRPRVRTRPGASVPHEQFCLTPVAGLATAGLSPSSPRRAAAHDAPD
ncbi:MAG: hypothetical protein AVDCRST_MAG53-350 [uncultured Solirubrobacteraceae bacterium]|uniref:Uncharacterized protein n=1 Tax=uncultured Solirubrobacteraceae bacterium TaxID=1162706 RepID=A0A6J4RTW0_9ACTN|nr:MAG: hypothetical protein AVDCRST_MAG53-350 [uncultured Solirubrobacteraceae bacterium]